MRVYVTGYSESNGQGFATDGIIFDTTSGYVYNVFRGGQPLPYYDVKYVRSLRGRTGTIYNKRSSGNLFIPAQFTAQPAPRPNVPSSSLPTLPGYQFNASEFDLGGDLPFMGSQGGSFGSDFGFAPRALDPLDEYAMGLETYGAPSVPEISPNFDFEMYADLTDQAQAVPLQHTHHLYNSPFGHLTFVDEATNEVGRGVDRVPVYIVNANLEQQVGVRYHTPQDVVGYVFQQAYSRVLQQNGRAPNANDYAQIRLQRPEGSDAFFDIVSDLSPYYEVVDDFITAFELLLQSEGNKAERRAGGFLAEMLEMSFYITFVLADDDRNPGNSMLTVNNIGDVVRQSSAFASNSVQRRQGQNSVLTRNRWVVQHELGVTNRAAISKKRLSPEEFQARREEVRKKIQKRKRPLPIPEDLEAQLNPHPIPKEPRKRVRAQQEGKRGYTPRRSAEEIAAIRALGPEVTEIANYTIVNGQPVRTGRNRMAQWTEEERAAYNARRREKYKAGKETRGIYEDLKRRTFHHASIEQFFQYSKAVLQVPNTWKEGYCLAMAFIKSECRTYVTDGSEVRETQPYATQPEHGEYACAPILEPFAHLVDQDCDFITGDSLLLFNPYKYPSLELESSFKYALRPPDEVVQRWYQAAQNLHLFVSETLNTDLDENSEATLQAYADVFDVHIAVYNLEVRGKRTVVIKPRSTPMDLRKVKYFRVVSLLISDNHCSAITNLRAFLKNNTSANRSSVHNYCVFCEKLKTANNQTAEEAQNHFLECMGKKDGSICCDSDKKNREKSVRDVHPAPFMYDSRARCNKCRLCGEALETGVQLGQIHHVCYMNKNKAPKIGESQNVYVYDFECEQVAKANTRSFVHRVNLVCVRSAYPDENGDCDRHCFATLEEFMTYIMAQSTKERVYLAHNGSKYDVQFIVKYLEKNMIPHHFVPAPGSMHAYLSVTMAFGNKASATFLDFRHFMPGSLKNIAISFGLSLQKGDFPHHFNNGHHEQYVGRIPELDHASDYWCLISKKSEEEVAEFREWYQSQELVYCTCDAMCTCNKKKWSFQEEIVKYCWLDVDVLAEAASRYRDWAMSFGQGEDSVEGWEAKPVDPFQYLTIPQLAMTTLMAGLPEEETVTVTPYKIRSDRVSLAIAWMERLQEKFTYKIRHIGNWHKEFFEPRTERFLDGVTDDMHVFVCLNCVFHACPYCFFEEIQTGVDHPTRPATYAKISGDTRKFIERLMLTYGTEKTHLVWEHDLTDYSDYEHQLGNVMVDREMFKGGRTEVFSPFCNAAMFPNDNIQYFDVCSLYPYVCAFTELPTGQPIHLCGREIETYRIYSSGEDRYCGYVRCTVIPNNKDVLGLLPYHDPKSKRLEFPLHEMTGSWGTEELRLACENGYKIKDVFEVYHWPKEERSDTFMRGYVSFFLRMKQEAEGWKKLGASSEEPTEEEKAELVETLFAENGHIGRIRPELVKKNPINRALAKTFLNSLWGKFCQRAHTDHYATIHSYSEFAQLWNDPHLDRSKVSFRYLTHGTWKVKYHLYNDFAKENPKYNIFIAAKVTETARCILHRQMLKIGPERVLYCDTDSIMFLWPKTAAKLDAHGLGKWVDEYPRQRILRLYALAPKFYYLEFEDDALLKSKGIMMNWTNRALLHGQSLGKQLLELLFPRTNLHGEKMPFQGHIPMRNILIGVHTTTTEFEYGTMLTRETNDKKLQPVLTKRHLVPYLETPNVVYDEKRALDRIARIYTIPKGYFRSVEEMSKLLYTFINY